MRECYCRCLAVTVDVQMFKVEFLDVIRKFIRIFCNYISSF